MHIFFDEIIDSSKFYEEPETENFEVGCSSATCFYYSASNVHYAASTW